MINGALAVLLNVILNLILIKPLAHRGLALATSLSAIVTTLLLFYDLRKRIGSLGYTKMIISFIKILIASLIMGALVYLIYFKFGAILPQGNIIEMGLLLLSVALGVVVYFALLLFMKVKEVTLLARKIM